MNRRIWLATILCLALAILALDGVDLRRVALCNNANLPIMRTTGSQLPNQLLVYGATAKQVQSMFPGPYPKCEGVERNIGLLLMLSGNPKPAIESYDRLLVSYPRDNLAWFHLAQAKMSINASRSEVVDAYRRAEAAPYWITKGIREYDLGQTREAIGSLQMAFDIGSNDLRGAYYLGLALQSVRDWPSAANAFQVAIQIGTLHIHDLPSSSASAAWLARSYAELARSRWELGASWFEVRMLFDQGIAISPKQWDVIIQKCESARLAGALEEAVAACRAGLQVGGENFTTTFYMGLVYYAARDFTGAIRFFQKAHRFNPEHASTMALLGTSWLEVGDLRQALAAFDPGIIERTEDVFAVTSYAYVLQKAGKVNEAILYYKRACLLDPSNATVSRALANLSQTDCN